MTASVLLFDGHVPGDPALENSHWIAERTLERLGEHAKALTHPGAVRANLERHLGDPALLGLAVFGHGDPGQLHTLLRTQHRGHEEVRAAITGASEAGAAYGSDGEPALDLRNLDLLRGRWCHAVACNVGLTLVYRAIEKGARCFVAYETSLTPEWEATALPAALHARLGAVVTATTVHLHAGIHDVVQLKTLLQEAIDALEEWLDGEEGAAWCDGEGYMRAVGLRVLARQLKRAMVVQTMAA